MNHPTQTGNSNQKQEDYVNNFMDNGWTNQLIMDQNHQLLYDMDFPTHVDGATPTNNIVQSIQFQNHVSPDVNGLSGEDDLLPHIQPIHIPLGRHGQSSAASQQRGFPIKQNRGPPLPPTASIRYSSSTMNSPSHSPVDGKKGKDSPTKAEAQTQPPHPAGAGPAGDTQDKDNKKTSKTRRPCDHCRRRKTKCVLAPGTTNCVQCEAKSLTCTFVGQAVKRKATAIEDPAAVNSMGISGTTSQRNMEFFTPNHLKPPNVPIREVSPVQDYSSMNNSLLKKTLSLQFPRSSFYIGPSSYIYDINLLNMIIDSQNRQRASSKPNAGKIEQINLSDSISLRKVSEETQFVLKDDQSPQSYQTMSNDVDAIEKFVAPHGQILIDLYFRIIHPSYPILHKKVFLEKYSRTHREFSAPLLAAVYVLAIQWWDYDPSLNRFPKPNVEMILRIGLNNYLLEILKRPKLSAVQAGLLLLQCKHIVRVNKSSQDHDHGNGSSHEIDDLGYSDWVLCSQVISLAEELGLGLDCTDWKLPKWERGLRKRLAWAVFIEDKWLALKNSRPSHINEMNWVVTSLIEEDFPEKHGDGDLKEGSSDIDNGKKIFMYLIELSTILSNMLDTFYSMKAVKQLQGNINEVLRLAKPIQLQLRNWYHSLPAEIQMASVQPRKLCSNGYLQLAYFATELTLHRKIITGIYTQTLNGNPPAKELINVCRTAAKTRLLAAIDFVRDLKPEHIHSFWHSSSASNFTLIGTFASILFISSTSREESSYYRDQIFNYRWILKISSKGFDQVGDALQQLDLVLSHVPGLLNKSADLPMVVPTVEDVPIQRPDSAQSARDMSNPSVGPFVTASPSNQHQNLHTPQNSQTISNTQNSQNPNPQTQQKQNPQTQNSLQSSQNRPTPTRSPSLANKRAKPNDSPYDNLKPSPQSSQGMSPKEYAQNRHNSFNNSTIDPSSPNTVRSKPTSPSVTRSPVSNRNDE